MIQHLLPVLRQCLDAAYQGTLDFPSIVGRLMEAGIESYHIDYRRGAATYFLPDGSHAEIPLPHPSAAIGPAFQVDHIAAAVRAAQTKAPGYTYQGFCDTVTAAGCAGYLVSFPGRRVVYYGRTAETHVEHFPR